VRSRMERGAYLRLLPTRQRLRHSRKAIGSGNGRMEWKCGSKQGLASPPLRLCLEQGPRLLFRAIHQIHIDYLSKQSFDIAQAYAHRNQYALFTFRITPERGSPFRRGEG